MQPTGCITFFYSYYSPIDRARRQLKLGRYGAITLTQAKVHAKRNAGLVASGIDPQLAKKEQVIGEKKTEVETQDGFITAYYIRWVNFKRLSTGVGHLDDVEQGDIAFSPLYATYVGTLQLTGVSQFFL